MTKTLCLCENNNFLNRNVSKSATSVNPLYGLLKREKFLAIILPNFKIVSSVISEGEGREPKVLFALTL